MSIADRLRSASPASARDSAAYERAVEQRRSRGFLLYIHQFRAIAIMFVIASHTHTTFDWTNAPFSRELVATVFGNGTFLFVFIAGFIFQYLLYKFDTRSYYMSKIKNVILPYLIAGFPAVLVMLMRNEVPDSFPNGFREWPEVVKVVWLYATGTMLLPLWFIPMISIMYLLGPLLARADRSGSIYKWLPLLFLLSLFIPRSIGNDNPVQAFLIYFPVYLLGMWSARNIELVTSLASRFWVLLAVVWIGLVATGILWSSATGAMYTDSIFIMHEDVINLSNIEKTVLCYLLIALLFMEQQKIGSRLNVLADMSFGLFFLHEYFILAARLILRELDTDLAGSVILYLTYTALVVAVTLTAVLIVKHTLGGKSRFVVGS